MSHFQAPRREWPLTRNQVATAAARSRSRGLLPRALPGLRTAAANQAIATSRARGLTRAALTELLRVPPSLETHLEQLELTRWARLVRTPSGAVEGGHDDGPETANNESTSEELDRGALRGARARNLKRRGRRRLHRIVAVSAALPHDMTFLDVESVQPKTRRSYLHSLSLSGRRFVPRKALSSSPTRRWTRRCRRI